MSGPHKEKAIISQPRISEASSCSNLLAHPSIPEAWIIKGEIVDYLQSRVPGLNRAAGRRCLLMPSLPYMPGFLPIQLYQRVQNHFIESFEGKFD